jgi:hypothetical protein
MKAVMFLPILMMMSCARTDIYYPGDGKAVIDERGRAHIPHNRAVVLNGSDSLGHTSVEVTRNGVRFASAGGIDNSTSTREGYRTVRYGIGAAAIVAGTGIVAHEAAAAYGSNQAASSASNVAASKSASSQAATQAATRVQLAEIQARSAAHAINAAKAVPAAGSTINAVIPATVVPVP